MFITQVKVKGKWKDVIKSENLSVAYMHFQEYVDSNDGKLYRIIKVLIS